MPGRRQPERRRRQDKQRKHFFFLTVNIAAALASHGAHVLVIDMDPQGNASTACGVPHGTSDPSVYDVLEGRMTIGEVLKTCPDIPGLDVFPLPLNFRVRNWKWRICRIATIC